ncbi:Uncharacterized protein PHSC3_001086 [Chlamydiales bacterium STE3]|nr:Uncharacterized protein PHSC3_001086 [Chlamydiales bacterium STE3]
MRIFCLFLTLYSTLYHFTMNAETAFAIGEGYREDNLNWSIAGLNDEPNILSELDWKNIKMVQISGAFCQSIAGICFFADGDYAKIYDGKNRDSDYFGNHRTLEFSRSYADASKGHAYDLCTGIGWNTNFLISPIEFCPQIGYSYHKQHLTLRKGVLVIDRIAGKTGPINGLNSSYVSCWHGPWIGFDTCVNFYSPLTIFGGIRAHLVSYKAKGHWNLRSEFADNFIQEGVGYGLFGQVGIQYDLTKRLTIGILGSYQEFKICYGRDRLSFRFNYIDENGNTRSAFKTIGLRLNEVNWDSLRLQAYITFNF